MTINEIKAFAESTAPMFEWFVIKDFMGRDVVSANYKKWEITLLWREPSEYFIDGSLSIGAQAKTEGFGGPWEKKDITKGLIHAIKHIDKLLLEDVQISLF